MADGVEPPIIIARSKMAAREAASQQVLAQIVVALRLKEDCAIQMASLVVAARRMGMKSLFAILDVLH